jgi:hemerythrin superfamily protein
MDALDLLEQQHRDIRERMERLAAEVDVDAREAALPGILRGLEAHVGIEEVYIYAASRLSGPGEDGRLRTVIAEHASLRASARELGETRPSGPRFLEHLAVLRDRFGDHADEEEDWVFPKLKRVLTDEELDVLGEELEHAYSSMLGVDPVEHAGDITVRIQRTAPPLVISLGPRIEVRAGRRPRVLPVSRGDRARVRGSVSTSRRL